MRNVNLLLELQRFCDQEAEIKKRLRESAFSLSALEKVFTTAEKQWNELKQNIASHKGVLLVENLQLETIEANIKKWNKELFTTHTANPKYLRDIEAKIKENETAKSHSEDKVLEIMDLMEADETKSIQIEKDYFDAQSLLQFKKEAHAALLEETNASLRDLERKKSELRLQIDEEWLETFDKTFLQCQGKAVSIIAKGTCQICRFMLPTSKLDQLYTQKDELHFCDNCKRIIMVD